MQLQLNGCPLNALERRLAALGRTEIDHDLTDLERAVWEMVDARSVLLPPMPNSIAIVLCGALAILSGGAGATFGAASARPHAILVAFAIAAPLTPSTILDE